MTETPETLHRELLDGAGYCRFCWYQVKNEGHAKDCIGAAYAAAWEDDGINYRTRIVELEAELNDLRKRLEAAERYHDRYAQYIRSFVGKDHDDDARVAALAGEAKPQRLGRDV
jgi:hypothetical protein